MVVDCARAVAVVHALLFGERIRDKRESPNAHFPAAASLTKIGRAEDEARPHMLLGGYALPRLASYPFHSHHHLWAKTTLACALPMTVPPLCLLCTRPPPPTPLPL